MLNWVRAFLGSRSQRVVIDAEESESIPVTSGVPQGSVLGPILFLIYINDLPDEVCSQVRIFADDTALYLTMESEDNGSALQSDLDILSMWETRWDMEFNPLKVVYSDLPLPRTLRYRGICVSRDFSHATSLRESLHRASFDGNVILEIQS